MENCDLGKILATELLLSGFKSLGWGTVPFPKISWTWLKIHNVCTAQSMGKTVILFLYMHTKKITFYILFKSIIDISTLLLYYLFDFILLEKPRDLSG